MIRSIIQPGRCSAPFAPNGQRAILCVLQKMRNHPKFHPEYARISSAVLLLTGEATRTTSQLLVSAVIRRDRQIFRFLLYTEVLQLSTFYPLATHPRLLYRYQMFNLNTIPAIRQQQTYIPLPSQSSVGSRVMLLSMYDVDGGDCQPSQPHFKPQR